MRSHVCRAVIGFSVFMANGAAIAQTLPDLRGTWTGAQSVHLIAGTSLHAESGTKKHSDKLFVDGLSLRSADKTDKGANRLSRVCN